MEQSNRCEQRRFFPKGKNHPDSNVGMSPDGDIGGETAKSLPGCKAESVQLLSGTEVPLYSVQLLSGTDVISRAIAEQDK